MFRRRVLALIPVLLITGSLLITSGCVQQAEPAPAEQRTSPPPWSAPRDAISYIKAAELEPLPLDITENQRTLKMTISIDGAPVKIPANVGIDRVRALQAAVHTHDDSGTVWLEGKGSDQVSLGEFFTVWGVRFDDHCLGDACGTVTVTVDGEPAQGSPTEVVLSQASELAVRVQS